MSIVVRGLAQPPSGTVVLNGLGRAVVITGGVLIHPSALLGVTTIPGVSVVAGVSAGVAAATVQALTTIGGVTFVTDTDALITPATVQAFATIGGGIVVTTTRPNGSPWWAEFDDDHWGAQLVTAPFTSAMLIPVWQASLETFTPMTACIQMAVSRSLPDCLTAGSEMASSTRRTRLDGLPWRSRLDDHARSASEVGT